MQEPKLIEIFADNGEHSNWQLIDSSTGDILWEELSPEDKTIVIEGHKFRRGDIYDIYEVERDKKMFLNREAGFIVQLFATKDSPGKRFHYSEPIAYESTSYEICCKKQKWEDRMKKAISIWENK